MKNAILAIGYPLSGKTRYYNEYYDNFTYFKENSLSEDLIQSIKDSSVSGEDIYIEISSPIKENRRRYIDLLKSEKYDITCALLDYSIESVLYYCSVLNNSVLENKKREEIFIYEKYFSRPSFNEGFNWIDSIVLNPKNIKQGKKKALFLNLIGTIIKIKSGNKVPTRLDDFVIIDGVYDTIKKFEKKGYSIIIYPADFPSYAFSNNQIKGLSVNVGKELGIDFKCICYDAFGSNMVRKYTIPNPKSVFNACENYSIDLENSIMVGSNSGHKALSEVAGIVNYFNCEPFFMAPEFVESELRKE